jgi:hypothetical protein
VLPFVDDVLVHLVGDGERVPLPAEPRDDLELFPGEDLPGGLLGVLMMIALVFLLNAFASSFSSNDQSGARSGTNRGVAPDRITSGP